MQFIYKNIGLLSHDVKNGVRSATLEQRAYGVTDTLLELLTLAVSYNKKKSYLSEVILSDVNILLEQVRYYKLDSMVLEAVDRLAAGISKRLWTEKSETQKKSFGNIEALGRGN